MEKTTMEFKYFAFISYNQKDASWGKRLQRRLESYRMPSSLCASRGWERKPIKPVFFAPTDIQPGDLDEELKARLRLAKHLIVICSKNSAQSEWVGKEIQYFYDIGRKDDIYFFIINGTPNAKDEADECFNPKIKELGLDGKLGADVHFKYSKYAWVNRERAYVQIISKLLGVEFDQIWQRHRRLMIQKLCAYAITSVLVIVALISAWVANRPVDVGVRLIEKSVHNGNLPPLENAVVTLRLDDEVKTDTISIISNQAFFVNIPHYMIGNKVGLSVSCRDWMPIDTVITLEREMAIDMHRDVNVYGDVHFTIWNISNECPVANCSISVDKYDAVSDSKGVVHLFIPIEEQKTEYKVTSTHKLVYDVVHVPSGVNDAVLIK